MLVQSKNSPSTSKNNPRQLRRGCTPSPDQLTHSSLPSTLRTLPGSDRAAWLHSVSPAAPLQNQRRPNQHLVCATTQTGHPWHRPPALRDSPRAATLLDPCPTPSSGWKHQICVSRAYTASALPSLCSGKVLHRSHHHGRLGIARQQDPDRAPPSQFDQDNHNGKRASLCPCGPRRSVSVPPRCTAPGCLTIIQSWLGPRPRLAALWHGHTYRPHAPAPRLLTPLFHPSAPQGAQQELLSTTPRVRTFSGEEESLAVRKTSRARRGNV